MQLRHEHPVFRRRRFFAGSADRGGESELADIAWFTPDGEHMCDEDWHTGYARSLMVFLNGEAIPEPDRRGARIVDDSFLLLFNAHHEEIDFVLPPVEYGQGWVAVLDTAEAFVRVDARAGGRGRHRARSPAAPHRRAAQRRRAARPRPTP